ncbi:hypothetical protein D3C81_1756640 [compost metagenome]
MQLPHGVTGRFGCIRCSRRPGIIDSLNIAPLQRKSVLAGLNTSRPGKAGKIQRKVRRQKTLDLPMMGKSKLHFIPTIKE